MDFTKAIMKNHAKDVDRIDNEVSLKLKDPNWANSANAYQDVTGRQGQQSIKAFTFDYNIDNAVIIFAEIKKRFEARGWRVLVLHNGQANFARLQLYR